MSESLVLSPCCLETVSRPVPGEGDWSCNNCHKVCVPVHVSVG